MHSIPWSAIPWQCAKALAPSAGTETRLASADLQPDFENPLKLCRENHFMRNKCSKMFTLITVCWIPVILGICHDFGASPGGTGMICILALNYNNNISSYLLWAGTFYVLCFDVS